MKLTFEECLARCRDGKLPQAVKELRACVMCDEVLPTAAVCSCRSPFYTVILANRIKRACYLCFATDYKLQSKWMG
jgi:hypothetical protein